MSSIGAGLGIGKATSRCGRRYRKTARGESKISKSLLLGCALAEATAIYGFVIALLIILFLG
ncbi:MAG: ATP F0F1 synthase subunit C [Lachnospira eligens]